MSGAVWRASQPPSSTPTAESEECTVISSPSAALASIETTWAALRLLGRAASSCAPGAEQQPSSPGSDWPCGSAAATPAGSGATGSAGATRTKRHLSIQRDRGRVTELRGGQLSAAGIRAFGHDSVGAGFLRRSFFFVFFPSNLNGTPLTILLWIRHPRANLAPSPLLTNPPPALLPSARVLPPLGAPLPPFPL
jgi:hypothetical protein